MSDVSHNRGLGWLVNWHGGREETYISLVLVIFY